MKNYFIIHGSFGSNQENWFPWLNNEIISGGGQVYCPNFPTPTNQTYEEWAKILDSYKDKINKDSVFICHSLAPIFIVRYLLENKIKIHTLISVCGFNCFINIKEFDEVNKSFFLSEIKGFEKLCKKRFCFFSNNDPYVPYYLLSHFAKDIKAKVFIKSNAGHFNASAGYTKFNDILKLLY